MGEEGIPPMEETRGIALRRDWVIPCTVTRRNWVLVSTSTRKRRLPDVLTRTTNNTDGDGLAKKGLMYNLLYSSATA